MCVDLDRLEVPKQDYEKQLNKIESQLNDIVKDIDGGEQWPFFKSVTAVNYRSPVQVKEILHRLGFLFEDTSKEALRKINHPFAAALMEHRKISKLISSLIDKLPKHINPLTNRIHPKFYQLGTESGRFTCKKPNLQQIPREQQWRDLFIAPKGYQILTADYSQIELRILAEVSQDPALMEAYRRRQDLHTQTAAEMFGVPIDLVTKEQRYIAKTINFGLCYPPISNLLLPSPIKSVGEIPK
jgi:DNA polymerase-1